MSNNPYAGRVPLNLRQAPNDEIAKSTSYRPGVQHRVEYRNPNQDPSLMRNEGCTPLRRYPDGRLDVPYVAQQVVDLIHKAENAGQLTSFEQALLSTILPVQFQLIDPKLAATMARLTDEERLLIGLAVTRHMQEELNYNAGRGGSIPGRHVTRS